MSYCFFNEKQTETALLTDPEEIRKEKVNPAANWQVGN